MTIQKKSNKVKNKKDTSTEVSFIYGILLELPRIKHARTCLPYSEVWAGYQHWENAVMYLRDTRLLLLVFGANRSLAFEQLNLSPGKVL